MSEPLTEEKFSAILSAVKRATTDNEKFAALLIVSKFTKAASLSTVKRRLLLKTIGIQFPVRLLATASRNFEGENARLYLSIGASIFSLFFTDKELARGDGSEVAVPLIGKVLKNFLEKEFPQAEDIMNDCFVSLSGFLENGECLESTGKDLEPVFETLCTREWTYKCKSGQLVQSMLQKFPWLSSNEQFIKKIKILAENFQTEQGKEKFSFCKRLLDFLSVVPNTQCAAIQDCLPYLVRGLEDVLCSKLVTEQRRPALRLTSEVLRCFGISRFIKCSKEEKFVVIVTRIACIEIGVLLRDLIGKIYESVLDENQVAFLASCYHIAELFSSAIAHFEQNDQNEDTSHKQKENETISKVMTFEHTAQMFSSLLATTQFKQSKTETKDVLTFELICLAQPALADMMTLVSDFVAMKLSDVGNLSLNEALCLQLSIRMLGSWLNIEYSAVSAQGIEMLPLIPKAVNYVTDIEELSLIKAMMPSIMQAGVLSNACDVLLENGVLSALNKSLIFASCKVLECPEDSDFLDLLLLILQSLFDLCVINGLLSRTQEDPERVEALHAISVTLETLVDSTLPMDIHSYVFSLLGAMVENTLGDLEGRESLIPRIMDFTFEAFSNVNGCLVLNPRYVNAWPEVYSTWECLLCIVTASIFKNAAAKKLYLATKWPETLPALVEGAKRTKHANAEKLLSALLLTSE